MISADSNIFVYLHDENDPARRATAEQVIDRISLGDNLIALQVVGEVQNVLRRKFKAPPWKAAQAGRNILATFSTFAYSRDAVEEALVQLSMGRYAFWDALLLASAEEVGCRFMLSEDMGDGSRFGSIEIVNPFSKPDGHLSERCRELLEL